MDAGRTATFFSRAGGTVAPPPPGVCWDRDWFITAGFTPSAQSVAQFGVVRSIHAVVWHDMEGFLAGAISRWNTGVAGAHLCVLRDGTIVRTVRLEDVAWHAGTDAAIGRTAFWKAHNVNPYSIGVELEGFAATGYTAEQAAAVKRITDYVTRQYGVLRKHTVDQITGHHAHSEISNQRSDPGPGFSWSWIGG